MNEVQYAETEEILVALVKMGSDDRKQEDLLQTSRNTLSPLLSIRHMIHTDKRTHIRSRQHKLNRRIVLVVASSLFSFHPLTSYSSR